MRERIAAHVEELVGRTPMVYLDRLAAGGRGKIAAKLEFCNPTGSIKDRIVVAMVQDAERRGLLGKGSVVVEPTSGNTGIGLACLCAIRGYRLILTVPDTLSHERRRLLKAYGAELVVTPGEMGMRGAIERAEEILERQERGFMLRQFSNAANPQTHERTTAVEIWEDTKGKVDVLVAGVGTGGTITGVGRYLKRRRPGVRVVAVEPAGSAVLCGRGPGPHAIQGIGPGFVPRVLDRGVIDEVVAVRDEEAMRMCRRLAKAEGIVAGFSSGAAAHAACRVARRRENAGKLVVVIFPDRGDKYLSTGLYE
jgi:cysteine synthase A